MRLGADETLLMVGHVLAQLMMKGVQAVEM